ncbi:hypothetical protein C1646_769023 [Rhizophagus diaphanus]|nr:hypothetical protein C1646_769023 [Rhizophagus diaphanus] [Rhizophagus sp. MUCL 43196]
MKYSSLELSQQDESNEGIENTEEKGTGEIKGTVIAKIIDLKATSSEIFTTIIQSESKYNNSETENESDAKLELQTCYQTSRWYHKEINANDYNVSFKSEKAQGAGTLLVDVCNFENFKSEYIKLAAAKKKSNSDNEEAICNESIPKINNNNKVPKISDIFTSSQPSFQQTIPSMAKFLHQINEIEKTEDYYFKFLEGFEKLRIKVKHLNKLNDAQFKACGNYNWRY